MGESGESQTPIDPTQFHFNPFSCCRFTFPPLSTHTTFEPLGTLRVHSIRRRPMRRLRLRPPACSKTLSRLALRISWSPAALRLHRRTDAPPRKYVPRHVLHGARRLCNRLFGVLQFAFLDAQLHRGRARRFDADDPYPWVQPLERHRYAGDQPASANRNDHDLRLREVFVDFQSEVPCPAIRCGSSKGCM